MDKFDAERRDFEREMASLDPTMPEEMPEAVAHAIFACLYEGNEELAQRIYAAIRAALGRGR